MSGKLVFIILIALSFVGYCFAQMNLCLQIHSQPEACGYPFNWFEVIRVDLEF